MKSRSGRLPRPRTTEQFIGMVRRMLRAAARRVGEDADGSLGQLLALQGDLDCAIVEAIAELRAAGVTWQEIGAAAGTTRQAALMRWGAKVRG